jgi:hypothetical protein
MPGRADYLVEQRGFEPLTSAVQAPARFTASSLPVLQSGRNGLRRDGFRRRFVSLRNAGPVLIADRNEPRYDVGPPIFTMRPSRRSQRACRASCRRGGCSSGSCREW